jgi:hypothetical protein
MFLIRTDHPHDSAAADDLALVANPFDRRAYLHDQSLQLLYDSPARQIARRQFQADSIPDQHSYEVLARPARGVGRDLPLVFNRHTV